MLMKPFQCSKNLQKLEMVRYPSACKLGKDETHKLDEKESVRGQLSWRNEGAAKGLVDGGGLRTSRSIVKVNSHMVR